ncbi:MAG: response regulator, partial [Polyangiaceae bacterium]|nr:response regulator [Polyangiaceae bacterium]
EQREYIVLAQGAGKDLLRIVSDILDFSKVEAGQLELESIQFDIFALVNRIVKQLRPGVTKKGIELTVAYADGVSRWCTGDPIRVGQILNNLLSNAIKFTEKGSVQLRVSRRLEMLRFDVTDSGLGIDENAIKRLFQPFRQADESTTRKYGGTGLGLAIAKALTHRMNGEIGAQSESGKGSTFWFCVRLPACTEVDDAPEPVSLRDVVKIQIQPTEMHARPILVAEDNPVNRRLMRGFLQQLSFRVVEVETGDAAIEEYKKGTAFAAILMDWQMPGCDGITATERIRTIEKMDRREHVPIIGLSANALAGDREQCMGAGMDEYLTKPIRFDVLRTVLKRWVRDSERPAAATSLDLKALHAALGMDDDDFGLAKEVIGIFLDSSTSNIDLMSRYVAENEMLELAKQAHTLKGSSSNIAANALARLSADLEKMARRGDGLGASRLFGQLRKEYEQVRIDCQRYLRGETPAPET